MMLRAAWLVDERWEKAYPIDRTLSIGRGAENAVILRDPDVSRLHATVSGEQDTYLLRSFGVAGTMINGCLADGETVLHEGDRIEIATSRLRFTCLEPDDEMIVLSRDNPVSLDRVPAATRAYRVPMAATTDRPPWVHGRLGAALALLIGSLLILLALR